MSQMHHDWAKPTAAKNNVGKIMFILSTLMNRTKTRQEYVQYVQEVDVGECVKTG